MRTTTRREQRPTGTRRTSTQRLAGAGRTTSRLQPRLQPRGLPRKGARKQSLVLGILSLVAFCLFWVFVVLAANSAVAAVAQEDGRRLVASVGLGLFSFVMPILGLVLGIIGVILKNSQKVVAGIGLSLNGVLVLWILLNMFSRH